MKLHFMLFFVIFVGYVESSDPTIDDVCLTQYLKKHLLLDDSMIGDFGGHQKGQKRCQKYIASVTENFYKFWKNHWKNQTPVENTDESVRCFITECRKYRIHDRYLLDILLRERIAKLKSLLQRSSIFYDRMLKENEKTCKIKGFYNHNRK